MIRTTLVSTVLVATLLAPASALAQVTAADVASFLGDWTLAMQGPNGPGTFNLSVKVEDDKVVGEIGSDALPTQKVTSISKTEQESRPELLLSMGGQFDRRGRVADAGTDGKVAAQMDFAGGAYTMTGTATKKEKAK